MAEIFMPSLFSFPASFLDLICFFLFERLRAVHHLEAYKNRTFGCIIYLFGLRKLEAFMQRRKGKYYRFSGQLSL